MTVLEVIQRSAEFLAGKGLESARLQAELLLAHALNMPRMRLYLEFERQVPEAHLDAVREMVRRRGRREPLQQIVGSASFTGLELKVTPDVLVPRPETELLAEETWKRASRVAGESPGGKVRVLDYGTGSGCIALAVAAHCPTAVVTAVDVSARALAVARENAERNRLQERVEFVEGDSLGVLAGRPPFDVIVSNPPYIPTAEIAALQPEVRDFEPRLALDGGADGLDFYRRFEADAPAWLTSEGCLAAEFGDGQERPLRAMFDSQKWVVEAILEDYTRRPRILIARRRPGSAE